jgi:hypothetical protein
MVEVMISNHDIEEITGYRTLTYDEAVNTEDLFNNLPIAILYPTNDPLYGHWVALLRFDNMIELFDPLGNYIDEITIGRLPPVLLSKIIGEGFIAAYNEYVYQKSKPDINTCGRWVIHRLLYKDLTNDEYHDLITDLSKKYDEKNLDKLIVELT